MLAEKNSNGSQLRMLPVPGPEMCATGNRIKGLLVVFGKGFFLMIFPASGWLMNICGGVRAIFCGEHRKHRKAVTKYFS